MLCRRWRLGRRRSMKGFTLTWKWAALACVAALVVTLRVLESLQAPITGSYPVPSQDNLEAIARAMQSYRYEHLRFPPAYLTDENGKPMHSWRVLLLPHLGQQDLYDEYDFSEPWNGPNNRRLMNRMPNVYTWPRDADGGSSCTSFVVVVGDDTIFQGSKSLAFQEIGDGLDTTILVVQFAKPGINWLEPRDLQFDDMSFRINDPSGRPGIRADRGLFAMVAMADASLFFLSVDYRPDVTKKLLTANGGEELGGDWIGTQSGP